MAGRLAGYKKLFDDVRQGRVRPLYFLHGPEEYMKREFVHELIHAVLPDGDRTFNLDILYGDEFDPQGFDDRLQAFPLFASRRLVVLRNFDAISPSQRDRRCCPRRATPGPIATSTASAAPRSRG